MHVPTCPVKMAGTLQRPCANCRLRCLAALSSGFGFSRSSKGIARRFLTICRFACPSDLLLVPVRANQPRGSAPVEPRALCRAIVFLPLQPSAADWAALPHGAVLRELYARKVRKEGDCCPAARGRTARDPAHRRLPRRRSDHLRAAASCRQTRAQRAGVRAADRCCYGSRAATASRSTRRSTRPSRRSRPAAFRFATFKSKPKPRTALARHRHRARAESCTISIRTLATSAGNNLARWLTALPPNTLDAARLSPPAERSGAVACSFNYQVLRRDASSSASAPALSWRSRKAMPLRDAGIVALDLSAARRGAPRP